MSKATATVFLLMALLFSSFCPQESWSVPSSYRSSGNQTRGIVLFGCWVWSLHMTPCRHVRCWLRCHIQFGPKLKKLGLVESNSFLYSPKLSRTNIRFCAWPLSQVELSPIGQVLCDFFKKYKWALVEFQFTHTLMDTDCVSFLQITMIPHSKMLPLRFIICHTSKPFKSQSGQSKQILQSLFFLKSYPLLQNLLKINLQPWPNLLSKQNLQILGEMCLFVQHLRRQF